jgi:predicted permease
MNKTIELLRTLVPVIAALGIGMLCRSRGLLTREGVNALKRVAVEITLPAMLLGAFATADYNARSLIIPPVMFAVCVLGWALGRLARRLPGLQSRFVPFLTTGFEAGLLGYTLYATLFGAEATPNFALVDLGHVLFIFTVYKFLLGMDARERPSFGALVRDMLTSPIIVALLVGVLLGATGLYRAMIPSGAAGILDACVKFIAAPTSVLILLSIGYDLSVKEIRWAQTARIVGARLVIMLPMMGAMLGLTTLLFGYERLLAGAIMLMFVLPPPFVLTVFADDEGQRAYISSALSVSTLVAIAGFAVLAATMG